MALISMTFGFCSSPPPVKEEPAAVEEPKSSKKPPEIKETYKPRERDFK